MTLLSQVLGIIAPYPAPPFDVGLEVSQLMGSLPDLLSIPLRQALSGLMTDLAISEGTAQLQMNGNANEPGTNTAAGMGVPTSSVLGSKEAEGEAMQIDGIETEGLGSFHCTGSDLSHSVSLLLAVCRRSRNNTPSPDYAKTPTPPPLDLIRALELCMAQVDRASDLLSHLIGTAMSLTVAMGELQGMTVGTISTRQFWAEDLPLLLSWWKGQEKTSLSFPVSRLLCARPPY